MGIIERLRLSCLGMLLLGLHQAVPLVASLSLYALGIAFVTPNSYALLDSAKSTQTTTPRFFSFSKIYVCLNIGALCGYILSGIAGKWWSYHQVYLLGFVLELMALGIVISINKTNQANNLSPANSLKAILIILSLLAIGIIILQYDRLSDDMILLASILALIWLMIKERDNPRIWRFFSFGIISGIFWVLYYMMPTTINTYIHQHIELTVLGGKLSSSILLGFGPLLLIAVYPLVALVNQQMKSTQGNHGNKNRFVLALVLIGVSFIVIAFGDFRHHGGYLPLIWIIVLFIFRSLAELINAPTGYAVACELARDSQAQPLYIGCWKLFSAIGIISSGLLAAHFTAFHQLKHYVHLPLSTNSYGFISLGLAAMLIGGLFYGIMGRVS